MCPHKIEGLRVVIWAQPLSLPTTAEHLVQRHPISGVGQPHEDQLLFGKVERTLGIEQAEEAVHPALVARFREAESCLRGLDLLAPGVEPLGERGAVGERVGHLAERGLDGLLIKGHVDVALHFCHIETRLQAAGLEDRDADQRNEVPGAGAASEKSVQRAAGSAGGGGQADARKEGRARGADARIGRAQAALRLQDVGAAGEHLGRHARRQFGDCADRVGERVGQQVGGHRCANDERQRILVLRDEAAETRNVGTRALQQLLRLVHVECRDRTGFGTAADQIVGLQPRFVGVARQRQAFPVVRECHPDAGDFGHQADLGAAARFFGAKVEFERLRIEAADAAEEIQFVGRKAHGGAVLAEYIGVAAAAEIARQALRGLLAGGADRGEQIGALDAVLRARLLDVECGYTQVAVVGERQRLSLAVAMIHGPEMLILDEPTSGVDPVARDAFWRILIDLARRDNVTIFISTHFMNEAERCDRISLMHAGQVLVSDTPAAIIEKRGARNLEEAFISHLEEAVAKNPPAPPAAGAPRQPQEQAAPAAANLAPRRQGFSWRRLFSYTRRESLELRRDPIRLTLASLGSVMLMLVLGYGISMDVEDLAFAVLDQDQTTLSRDYALNLAGSRYFIEHSPIRNHAELDQRMRAGEISLSIEIPPGFARDIARGTPVQIGAWIDGAMPMRAETVRGYVQGMHQHWLTAKAREAYGSEATAGLFSIETRFRYNPEVTSLPAMVPAVIPLLLMLIPAILSALSVVREKELGSIVNLYVTPVTRLEFLLGKQIPYIALAMINFLLLTALAVSLFGVPLKGSFLALAAAALLYVIAATAFGLLMSAFVRSQVAALFGTALLTILPAVQFSGLIDPVSTLEGVGALIGQIYPTTHFVTIARGTFSKGLGFMDLRASFVPLLIAVPVLIGLGAALLRKQER